MHCLALTRSITNTEAKEMAAQISTCTQTEPIEPNKSLSRNGLSPDFSVHTPQISVCTLPQLLQSNRISKLWMVKPVIAGNRDGPTSEKSCMND